MNAEYKTNLTPVTDETATGIARHWYPDIYGYLNNSKPSDATNQINSGSN